MIDFGGPDPSVQLGPPPALPGEPTGPMRKVEFVIEIVGPRTLPAPAAEALLNADWQQVLGGPVCWAMAPQDSSWQRLVPGRANSYDSLALTYPLIGQRGALNSHAARNLMQLAENFASQVERRAIPLLAPEDVDQAVRDLAEIQSSLDVGCGIGLAFSRDQSEEDVWKALVGLGLTASPVGEFVWGHENLLSVSPTDMPQQFSLRGVQSGRKLSGISLGFSVPRSPAPQASLDAALRVAHHLQSSFGGFMVDENGETFVANAPQLSQMVNLAQSALEQTGFLPGSPEALVLFG